MFNEVASKESKNIRLRISNPMGKQESSTGEILLSSKKKKVELSVESTMDSISSISYRDADSENKMLLITSQTTPTKIRTPLREDNESDEVRRRRGRPPGSKKKPKLDGFSSAGEWGNSLSRTPAHSAGTIRTRRKTVCEMEGEFKTKKLNWSADNDVYEFDTESEVVQKKSRGRPRGSKSKMKINFEDNATGIVLSTSPMPVMKLKFTKRRKTICGIENICQKAVGETNEKAMSETDEATKENENMESANDKEFPKKDHDLLSPIKNCSKDHLENNEFKAASNIILNENGHIKRKRGRPRKHPITSQSADEENLFSDINDPLENHVGLDHIIKRLDSESISEARVPRAECIAKETGNENKPLLDTTTDKGLDLNVETNADISKFNPNEIQKRKVGRPRKLIEPNSIYVAPSINANLGDVFLKPPPIKARRRTICGSEIVERFSPPHENNECNATSNTVLDENGHIKRKRGRPRKHPITTQSADEENLFSDINDPLENHVGLDNIIKHLDSESISESEVPRAECIPKESDNENKPLLNTTTDKGLNLCVETNAVVSNFNPNEIQKRKVGRPRKSIDPNKNIQNEAIIDPNKNIQKEATIDHNKNIQKEATNDPNKNIQKEAPRPKGRPRGTKNKTITYLSKRPIQRLQYTPTPKVRKSTKSTDPTRTGIKPMERREIINRLHVRKIPKERFEESLTMLTSEHPIWEERNTSCLPSIHRYWNTPRIQLCEQRLRLKYARQFLLRRDWANLSKVLCIAAQDSTGKSKKNYFPLLAKYGALCLAHNDKDQFNSFVHMLLNIEDGGSVLKICTQLREQCNTDN